VVKVTERVSLAPREGARQPGWRLPIAAYLAAGFGGLIALAVGTVLWLSLGTARQNTVELMRVTAQFATGALERGIAAHLQPARHGVEYVAKLLSDGSVPLDDDEALRRFLLGSLAGLPQVTSIAFVRDDLHVVRAGSGTDRIEGGPDTSSAACNACSASGSRSTCSVISTPGKNASIVSSSISPARRAFASRSRTTCDMRGGETGRCSTCSPAFARS